MTRYSALFRSGSSLFSAREAVNVVRSIRSSVRQLSRNYARHRPFVWVARALVGCGVDHMDPSSFALVVETRPTVRMRQPRSARRKRIGVGSAGGDAKSPGSRPGPRPGGKGPLRKPGNNLQSARWAVAFRSSSLRLDQSEPFGVGTRACVSETAHAAMQATINAAALAANNPVWPI
jgi:hypothetical protein